MRNLVGTLFASVGRALAQAYHSPTITNIQAKGVRVHIDVTAHGAAPSVVPTIEVWDFVANAWVTVLTGAAITTTLGHTILTVYPGVTVAANVAVSSPLGKTFRLTMTHSNTDNLTYSASYELLV